jgi:hypothetical protein
MLSVIMLSAIMLNVVAPYDVDIPQYIKAWPVISVVEQQDAFHWFLTVQGPML